MSSIERAMERLSGSDAGTPSKVPAAAADDSGSDDVAAQSGTTPDTVQTSLAEEKTGVGASATTAPVTRPPVEGGDATQPALVAPSPGPASPTAHVSAARISGEVTVVDFERLAAAGFLVPGQTMTREAEEFQRIKRRLLGNMVSGIYASERPANLILITSSVPGEGKTFVSVNLAISIAMEIDRTVLAIDTDIVKRDLSKVFGVVNRPGLFDLLANPDLRLQDLLVRTSLSTLTILPAGNRHTSSTEMLASQRMREITDEIAARYSDRVILFDSPPVLAMTTATALAPLAGQIVVVCEAGSTKHETIKETLHRLEGVRVAGVILNKSKQAYASGYDYYGSYGHQR